MGYKYDYKKIKEQVEIFTVLERAGFSPARSTSKQHWYYSPFRNEKTPSLCVDIEKNIFMDWGDEDKKGTVLDMYSLLHNVDIKKAAKDLHEMVNGNEIEIRPVVKPKTVKKEEAFQGYFIHKIEPFTGKGYKQKELAKYLMTRGIPVKAATDYLEYVEFKNNPKERKIQYALGWHNLKEGIEINNVYRKASIGSKSVTMIGGDFKGEDPQEATTLMMFESMIDFLSWLMHHKKERPPFDTLILNSTSHTKYLGQCIDKRGYTQVLSYLDNDPTGDKYTQRAREQTEGRNVTFDDCRYEFNGYKDYNEFLAQKNDDNKPRFYRPNGLELSHKPPSPSHYE